jgi:hypothetical protein
MATLKMLMVAIFASCASTEEVIPPEIAKMEDQILEQRRRVKGGRVVFRSAYSDFRANQATRGYELSLWREGDSVRADVLNLTTRLREVNSFSGTDHVFHHSNPSKEVNLVEVSDRDSFSGKMPFRQSLKLELVGLIPVPLLNLANQNRHPPVFGKTDWKTATTTTEKRGAQELTVLNYERSDGMVWRLSVNVKGDKFFVIRSEAVTWLAGEKIVKAVESEYDLDSSELAFCVPKRMVYRHYRGTDLAEQEIVDTVLFEPNSTIPPKTFALEGMNLPADTRIQYNTKKSPGLRQKKWDGSKVVTEPWNAGKIDKQDSSIRLYLIGGSLLAVVTILKSGRLRKSRAA